MQGIYKIENINNGKAYIGRSVCIEKRWKEHERMLKNGTHHSIKLQRAYNRLKDKSVLQFSVVEEVKDALLLAEREQFWADYYDAYHNGYGCTEVVDNPKYALKNQNKRKREQIIKEDYEIFNYYYNKYKESIQMTYSFKYRIDNKCYKHKVMSLLNKAVILCSRYLEHDGAKLLIYPGVGGYNNLCIKLYDDKNIIIEGQVADIEKIE